MTIRNSDIPYRPIFLLKTLGIAALYALLAYVNHLYFESKLITSVFEPTCGLALAALLIGGRKYALGVFIGALLANIFQPDTAIDAPFWLLFSNAAGYTLGVSVAAWLLARDGRFDLRLQSLFSFLLLARAAAVGGAICALIEATTFLAYGLLASENYSDALVHRGMGEMLGIMLVTPLILVWRPTKSVRVANTRVFEPALLLGLTFAAGQVVFVGWFHHTEGAFELVALGYWIFLFVVWIAVRLGIRGVTLALPAVAAQALWGANHGVGFFAHDIAQTHLANFWFYMLVLSTVGMALATYIAQRKQMEEVLMRSETRLRTLYDSTSDAVMLLDENGFFDCNRAALAMFGCASREAFCAKHPADLSPPQQPGGSDSLTLAHQQIGTAMELGSHRFEWTHKRADNGNVFPAEVLLDSMMLDGKKVLQATVRDITERKNIKQALMESEEKFRRLFEEVADPVLLLKAGRFVDCNTATLKMLGYGSKKAFLDVSPADISPPYQPDGRASAEKSAEMDEIALREGFNRFEWLHTRAEGSTVPVEVTLTAIVVKGERILHVLWRDITERKKAENKLMKLLLAVEQSPTSVVITDLDGSIEYVNQTFVNETGYSFAEAVGQNPRIFSSGKNARETYQAMWSCLTRGEVWKGELVNRRKDGSEYVEFVHISPVRQKDGQITHYLAIKNNISLRKSNEAKIERLSRTYRLLSKVNETIARVRNRDELFAKICETAVESNLFRFAWIAMLDEARNRVIPVAYAGVEEGYTDRVNIRLDDERTANGPIGRSIRTNTCFICQDIENDPNMTPWRDDALKRGYRASAAFPIHEAGVVTGTLNVYAITAQFFTPDITLLMQDLATDVSFALDVFADRRCREQAEADVRQMNLELERRVTERTRQLEDINRELETFSYSVSHDLRAPLRSIDGFSRNLSRKYHDQLDATGQDWLERVSRASQRMGHLIDDMLVLSQVSRGSLRREQIDLSEMAENTADELRKAQPGRQVRIGVKQGLSVQADPGLLRVVMDNLLGNAWKFTGKKDEAEIEFGMLDAGAETTFFVRDNGDGFNMEYADKLFGVFQRLHPANEFDGTGIGLATVQRIIRRHNGRVWAEGKEGEGATVYFTLPQRERERHEEKGGME